MSDAWRPLWEEETLDPTVVVEMRNHAKGWVRRKRLMDFEPGESLLGIWWRPVPQAGEPDNWRAGWVIRELKAVPRDDYTWTWLCTIERDSTRTVVHVPGVTPDMAIERAWEMAKMVEDATW